MAERENYTRADQIRSLTDDQLARVLLDANDSGFLLAELVSTIWPMRISSPMVIIVALIILLRFSLIRHHSSALRFVAPACADVR